MRLTLKHHELRIACSHTVITIQTLKHTILTEFQVFYLLEYSMNQQHARLPPVSNTTFIKTTQSKTATTNQQPFFRTPQARNNWTIRSGRPETDQRYQHCHRV